MDEAAESEFKIGDVVRLKSGGPWMVVAQIWNNEDGWQYKCIWFNEQEDYCDCRFPEETIQ